MKKNDFGSGIGFKIVLFFALAIGTMACIFSVLSVAWLWDSGAYDSSFSQYVTQSFRAHFSEQISAILYNESRFPELKDIERAFSEKSEERYITFEIRENGGSVCWSNAKADDKTTEHVYKYVFSRKGGFDDRTGKEALREYTALLYVAPEYFEQTGTQIVYQTMRTGYRKRNVFFYTGCAGLLLAAVSFIWLMCNVGHRKGQEGIFPGVLSNLYLDILTAVFGFVAFVILQIALENLPRGNSIVSYLALTVILSVAGAVEAVWCTIYFREFALRMKLGKWWRHSLIYVLCRFAWRCLKGIAAAFGKLLRGLPMVLHVAAALLLFTGFEFIVLAVMRREERFFFWGLEKLVVIPILLYCAIAFKKLQSGARALAQGDLGHKLDTGWLVLDFKEHGKDLNQIGEGISKAVEQRLRSERLKTELITNVSHDIKTPLTSVINYADLLGSVAAENAGNVDERIAEYSEVLFRQSNRLKKLLDDLVEASKATTGNLEVNLESCVLGVLLTQVAGEYEEKLAGKELQLHISQPEEEIRILADGRHLFRVFDNLMNNICKYAQEGSRVYLNVEQREEYALVIFRNMSKYELNIDAKELEERFVRGDQSRHMEGSGLGLSIAKSLVELQQGSMEIVTDGDLFKVVLKFRIVDH